MRRISNNAFSEIYFRGCNPSFVRTDDGIVLIDTPMRPSDAIRWRKHVTEIGPVKYLINTEPHRDHTLGNAYFQEAEVIGHVLTKERFAHYQNVPQTLAERIEIAKIEDPESVYLMEHPDYPSNPPSRTFADELTLKLGSHTFKLLHTPGHTDAQTTVYSPEERVAFIGDNIFHKCRTWLQEADPWAWLESLQKISKLDVDVIIPGHGEPCSKSYLEEQGGIVRRWLNAIEGFVDEDLTIEQVLNGRISIESIDRYPMDIGGFARGDYVIEASARNLFERVKARKARQLAASVG